MTKSPYIVFVADNFHYMDESKTYKLGTFATYEEAETACRYIVDRCLGAQLHDDTAPEKLFRSYAMYGEDPYIVPSAPETRFSAWDYARERCNTLCSVTYD